VQDDAVELPDLSGAFAPHGVAVAYLFGSRAEGTARPGSDHDVAALFTDPRPALDATVRLGAHLAGVLGTEVDVVDLDRAELELRGRVAERGRLLYSVDGPRRVRFEVDARLRWIDFRPVVAETTRAYLRRVASEGLRPRTGVGLMVDPNLPQPPSAPTLEASCGTRMGRA
jgi:predicted nucleotidyltransferase